MCLPWAFVYTCVCVHVRSRVCAGGFPAPHTHTRQAPGGGSSGGGGCDRETLLPACPAPTPGPYLPAASPTARTARSCGPGDRWGPSSCGVSCPWWAREPAREPKRSPTSPAAGPAALGGKQRDARAATADAPSPSSATPPGSAANGESRGGAGGGAGAGARPVGSAPQDLGDQLSRPAQSALGMARPVQVGKACCLSPRATYLRTAVGPR